MSTTYKYVGENDSSWRPTVGSIEPLKEDGKESESEGRVKLRLACNTIRLHVAKHTLASQQSVLLKVYVVEKYHLSMCPSTRGACVNLAD